MTDTRMGDRLVDLLSLAGDRPLTPGERRSITRKSAKPSGYAAMPGTGPAGETCKSCKHIYRKELAKTYRKCLLRVQAWTGGARTDILAGSPACRLWERPDAKTTPRKL